MDGRRLDYLRRRAQRYVRINGADDGETPPYAEVEKFLVDKCGLLEYEQEDEDFVALMRDELELLGDPLGPSEQRDWLLPERPGSPLVLVRDATGWRHVLEDRPVAVGAILELEGVRGDEATGEWIPVRYEAELVGEAHEVRAYLVANVAGHEARIVAHSFMRLRRPVETYARERSASGLVS